MSDVLTCTCGAKVRVPPAAAPGQRLFRCPRCKADIAIGNHHPHATAPLDPSLPVGTGRAAGNCPICQTAIESTDQYVTCPKCDQVHHQECWREIGGCSTYGCEQAPAATK